MPREETVGIAQALAHVVKQEMSFPVQPSASTKAGLVNRLHDTVPTREVLSFQQRDGESIAKTLLGEELIADEEEMIKLFFCVFHGEFVQSAGTDIDHVFSFHKMREKQIKLLEFINTDREFADVFLDQPGIEDYFKRDTADGLVKGTSYFFKLCYNDMGNLLLMCHACNIQKSSGDPLDWFKQQDTYFGPKFLESIREKGNYHEGILLGKVYPKDGEHVTLNILGEDVDLYTGDSYGLGQLAREWFTSQCKSILDSHREFYGKNYRQFKETLAKMRSLVIEGKTGEAHNVHRHLVKALSALQGVYAVCMAFGEEKGSSSGSDDSADREARDRISARQVHIAFDVAHELKKIKTLFVLSYGDVQAEVFRRHCIEYQEREALSVQAWREIFEVLDELKAKISEEILSVEGVSQTITQLYDERSPKGLRKRAEEAEQRTKREAQLREQETRRADRETRANALLRARIAEFEAAQERRGEHGMKRPAEEGDDRPDEAKRGREADERPPSPKLG